MRPNGIFRINSMIISSLFVSICTACAPAPPSKPVSSGFIGRFDKNNDGRVSRREYPGPARNFNRLDKNKDGFVDANEAP